MNVFLIGGIGAFCMIVGFLARSWQIGSLHDKIGELEKEMLASHAEILELQKEKVTLSEQLEQLKHHSSPVIPISVSKEEIPPEKLKEVSPVHKKMIASKSAKNS